MKMVTAAKLLSDFGPCTSSELRAKAGINVTGCPLSTFLHRLFDSGYASKKVVGKKNVFALKAKGKKWLEQNIDEAQTVEELNNTNYGKSSSKVVINHKVSKTAGSAMDSMALLVEINSEAMAMLRGIQVQIENYLQQHGEFEE